MQEAHARRKKRSKSCGCSFLVPVYRCTMGTASVPSHCCLLASNSQGLLQRRGDQQVFLLPTIPSTRQHYRCIPAGSGALLSPSTAFSREGGHPQLVILLARLVWECFASVIELTFHPGFMSESEKGRRYIFVVPFPRSKPTATYEVAPPSDELDTSLPSRSKMSCCDASQRRLTHVMENFKAADAHTGTEELLLVAHGRGRRSDGYGKALTRSYRCR